MAPAAYAGLIGGGRSARAMVTWEVTQWQSAGVG